MEIKEIWIDVQGYENSYQVSNLGRVKTFAKGGKILKRSITYQGYVKASLWRGIQMKQQCVVVHRLVMQAFHPLSDPENYVVNHLNGIKDDNRLENLEWTNNRENVSHGALKMKKSSKYVGVTYKPERRKFVAQICLTRTRTKYIGIYETEELARDAVLNFLASNNLTNKYI